MAVEVAVKDKNNEIKKTVKKMKKICKGTLDDLLLLFESKIPSFLEHVFVKREQFKYFEEKLTNLDKDEAVIQVDFAENYTCKYQDEIQSAHWNQEQVTLFTVAIWTKNPSAPGNLCKTHVIVSDDVAHDKTSVSVFMSTILDDFVKKMHPNVTKAYIFSDGPGSQFKNKYIVNFLHKLNQTIHIQWNFFATTHGKGVVDGVGGTIKRLVWKALIARKAAVVVDAKTFYLVAKQLQSSVNVSLIDKEQILKKSDELCLKTCFDEAPALPGISKFHCIEPTQNGFVHCRKYSNQNLLESNAFSFDSDDTGSDSWGEETRSDNCSKVEDRSDYEDNDNDGSDIIIQHGHDIRDDENDEGSVDISYKVQHGIPQKLLPLFQNSSPFVLPQYIATQVDSIMSSLISFGGGSLIDINDLQSLFGNSEKQEDNWLSNFVIDMYLSLIQSGDTKINVLTLSWELFEKGTTDTITSYLTTKNALNQDLILIPCNPIQSSHWYLLAVFPKEKLVVVLDSLVGTYVKPSTERTLTKISNVLKAIEPNCNIEEWTFAVNRPDDIPQQSNAQDCGVFTCLYGRCLAGLGPMVDAACIPEFHKCIIFSEHRGVLQPIPVPNIELEQYYAVDYIKNYYIGRAVSVTDGIVKFKFLHRVSATKFAWPRRDDFDEVHKSCIFFGPVPLQESGPFVVPLQHEIEKIFSAIR